VINDTKNVIQSYELIQVWGIVPSVDSAK